ncbi:hypothetical protein Tco_0364477 [Tanacetum coccineum]
MSFQDMEFQKQQYLEEMQSISNHIQNKDYRDERIDIHYRRACEIRIDELKANFNKMSIEINKKKELRQREQERTILLNEIISQIPASFAITPVLPTMEPEDSHTMGDENLSTIPEMKSDEFIKSSVEEIIPIRSESEDTFDDDSECDLPSCDYFSSIDVPRDNSVTLSNPLFDSNDDFTSSDDESLSDKDDIENKDSYVSNHDEPALLVTPLSYANEDECFDPGGDIDEIDAFLDTHVSTDIDDGYHDSEEDIIYLESLPINDIIPNLPPEVFLDHDPRSLKDEPDNDDLKSMVKNLSSLSYLFCEFSFLLSSGSEDTIFDPGISALNSLELVVPDIDKKTKTRPNWTKPSTRIERAYKTKDERIFMFNEPTRHVENPKAFYWLLKRGENPRAKKTD